MKVAVFEADGKMEFVRVHLKDPVNNIDNVRGRFMALASDIEGLSPQELQSRFDLPYEPTHVAKAVPPKGTQIVTGIVEKENFGGKGGGTQFYVFERPPKSWFSDVKEISSD